MSDKESAVKSEGLFSNLKVKNIFSNDNNLPSKTGKSFFETNTQEKTPITTSLFGNSTTGDSLFNKPVVSSLFNNDVKQKPFFNSQANGESKEDEDNTKN